MTVSGHGAHRRGRPRGRVWLAASRSCAGRGRGDPPAEAMMLESLIYDWNKIGAPAKPSA